MRDVKKTALAARSKHVHPDSANLPEAGFALGRCYLTAMLHDTQIIAGGIMVPVVTKYGNLRARHRMEAGIRYAQYVDLRAKLKGYPSPFVRAIDYGGGVSVGGGRAADKELTQAEKAELDRKIAAVEKSVRDADDALGEAGAAAEEMVRFLCLLDNDIAGMPFHNLVALRRGLDRLVKQLGIAKN